MLKSETVHYLTPNRRLASRYRFIALDDWLAKLWDELEIQGLINQYLLTPGQANLKWESIVEGPMAALAREAWELTQRWLDLEKITKFSLNVDHEAFLTWAHEYEHWLAENDYVDPICIEKILLPILKTQPPQKIVLFGFENLAPSFLAFFRALEELGWQISEASPDTIVPQTCHRQAFSNQKQEIQAVASWARDQKNKKIGIVIPNLNKLRSKINEAFESQLDRKEYNITAGIPLSDYPIIQAAFKFLKLTLSRIAMQDFAIIFTSVYAKGAFEESIRRAKLIPVLKNIQQSSLTLLECLSLSQGTGWFSIIEEISTHARTARSCYQWSEYFRKILKIIGWPGERSLTSSEYQIVQKWNTLLDDFAQYDEILDNIKIEKALSMLEKMARKLPFQPENKEANIHIMGVLEAAGLQFEKLWIMNMDNESWPPACSPNPFIPYLLQREHQLPRSSADREWDYAQKITERFMQSAHEIVFSYAIQDEGKSLAPSRLIKSLELMTSAIQTESFPKAQMEEFTDEQAPQINSLSATASTLSAMATCPFKAFASHRLKIRTSAWSTQWLQPFQRGILLHGILESVCQPQIDSLKIKQIIKTHLKKIIHKEAPQIYFEAELAYLYDVVCRFIETEKMREPFKILATEMTLESQIEGLHFRLRLDRIDQIGDEITIIDYKTGNYSKDDPQFALYLLASADLNPTNVTVCKLSATGCRYENIEDLDKLKIIQLIQQFKQGNAMTTPSQACQHCEMAPLCRVGEK